MAERYMFFNSTATDRRRHQASDMADYWMSFLSSGLIHEDGQPQLEVVADGTSRNVTLSVGRALLKGHLYINDADLNKVFDGPDATLDRIDRLVLRYDNTIEERSIRSFIIKGIEAEDPEPPALTREGDIYEISLAQIRVVAGKSFIEQSDIIDERLDESVCGLASSLVSVPTDHLMREWYEWFDNIKQATYITEGEFSQALGQVNMNIANLALYQDASNRIKSGTLFGTDAETSFGGIEVDFTRTELTANYTAQSSFIEVDSATGFFVGHEITIYDDANLERTKILDIDGNTLEVEPLENDYEMQTNVARTMMEYDDVEKAFKFGAFGTLSDVLIDADILSDVSTISIPSFISVQDTVFYIEQNSQSGVAGQSNFYLTMRDKFGNHTRVEHFGRDSRMPHGLTTDGSRLFLIFKIGSSLKFNAYDREGNLLNSYNASGDLNPGSALFYDGKIFFTHYASSIRRLYYTVYDEVNDEFEPQTLMTNGTSGSNVPNQNILGLSPNSFVVFNLVNTMAYIDHYLGGVASFSEYRPETGSMKTGGVVNGKFTLVSILDDEVTVHSTDDFISWNTTSHTLSQIPSVSGATIDRDGTIHLFFKIGDYFYISKKEASVPNFSDEEQMGSSLSELGAVSSLYNPISHNQKYKKPLFLFRASSAHYLMGEITVGDGDAVNTNDIRFILPPTKNLATFTASTNDVTAIGGSVNGVPMEIKNTTGQQQFVGRIPEKKPVQVRLTYERNQTDTDSFIYKIVGGID